MRLLPLVFIMALTKDLNADDFELRQKAEHDLEASVRKMGQPVVDLLARETFPASETKGDRYKPQ